MQISPSLGMQQVDAVPVLLQGTQVYVPATEPSG